MENLNFTTRNDANSYAADCLPHQTPEVQKQVGLRAWQAWAGGEDDADESAEDRVRRAVTEMISALDL